MEGFLTNKEKETDKVLWARVSRGLYDVALCIQTLILLGLLVLSLLITVEFVRSKDKIDVFTEYLTYRWPSVLFPLLFIVIAAVLFYLSRLFVFISDKHLFAMVFLVTLVFQLIWISALSLTNYWYADSISLMRAADAILNYDFDKFDPSSCAFVKDSELSHCLAKPDLYKGNLYQYFSWYPYQAGPMMWFLLIFFIFGSYNVLAFQIVNAFFISGIATLLMCMAKQCGLQKRGLCLLAVMLVTCLPLLMFSAFVYTNVVGVFFGMLSMYLASRALSMSSTHKTIAMLASAYGAGSLTVLIKTTYIIFLIAITIVCVLHFISHANRWSVLFGIPMLVAANEVSKLPIIILEYWTGQKFGSGMPMTAWLVIGLREDSPTGPGWWTNVALQEYRHSAGDYGLQSLHFKENLLSLFDAFVANPNEAVSFFSRKIASEWAEPTFQTALYSSQGDHVVTGGLEQFFLTGSGYKMMVGFDNVMQSMVYGLALVAVIALLLRSMRHRVECAPISQMLTITFIGGFLCYVFWEAKSIYALPFYLLLLPLSATGGQYVIRAIQNRDFSKKCKMSAF